MLGSNDAAAELLLVPLDLAYMQTVAFILVIAAVVQGAGRAVGEAMAILMVAGNVANMPSLFASVRFLTTAVVSEMSYAAYGSLQRDALFSVGLVLFFFILLINAALRLLGEGRRSA